MRQGGGRGVRGGMRPARLLTAAATRSAFTTSGSGNARRVDPGGGGETPPDLSGYQRPRWTTSSNGRRFGPLERHQRPVGGVAEREQRDGEAVLGEAEQPRASAWSATAAWLLPMPRSAAASAMLIVAWPWSYCSQPCCRSSSSTGPRQHDRRGRARRRARRRARPAPARQLRAVGHEHEVPRLPVPR